MARNDGFSEPTLGKDRNLRMKILFLSPWFPTPPVNGSKIRIYHLLKALSGRHTVNLISFVRPDEEVDENGLAGLCRNIQTVPFREFRPQGWRAQLGFFSRNPRSVVDTFNQDMARAVQRFSIGMDVVVASQLSTASYRFHTQPGNWIFDEVELAGGKDAWLKAKGLKRFRRQLTWYKTKGYMRRLLPRFSAATVVSQVENNILAEAVSGYFKLYVIPNGVDTNYNHPGISDPIEGRMVYSGALTYTANFDAVKFFLGDIFPRIQQQHLKAHLEITGSTLGVDLDRLILGEEVRLTGFVEDIRPVVSKAWVCVVPLRQGGGTRLKILEAMALGTPVVSTSKGAEGLAVTHDQDILIADQSDDFARQVVRLLGDADLRARLAVNGRHLVEQRYSWQLIGKDFCALVESTVDI